MSKNKPKIAQAPDFEAAMQELNQIVEQMEQGGLSLEQSLQQFERGTALVRTCQTALQSAEQKVRMLTEQNGQTQLTAFNPDITE